MKLHLVLEDMIPGEQREQLFRHVDIHGITANSSEVRKNDVFVAIPGCQRDGHDFIHDAIKAGAAVVVGEKDIGELGVPYIKVPNSRLALGKMAGKFYEKPSNKHKIIGVTGTNGKTTTSFMLKQILEDAGLSCSLIGTVLNEINGQVMPSTHTTPDALKLHKLIFDSKDDVIIIEVSSHGLSQHRVEGVQFDCCLFTNLDHEHLDYHRDMEDYFSVKASLFDKLNQDGKAVVNGYNSWGEKLIKLLKHKQNSMFILGDSDGYDLRIGQGGRTGTIMLHEGAIQHPLSLKVPGSHNAHNAAMAFLTARALDVPREDILQSLQRFSGVTGRFEMMKHPSGATIIIDYAHTADAFFHCLKTAREHGARRVIHVFGFRGGRDESKRRGMVNVSRELSDLCILTLDDLNKIPREEMIRTLHELNVPTSGVVIPDRTMAIQFAWEQAEDGDWIMITGKGSEIYQQSYDLPTASDRETIHYLNAIQ